MNKKIVCFSLFIGLILGFGGSSVYAEETDSTQEVTNASSEVACNVSVTNDASEFVVNIPKNVVGSGKSGVLSYTVSVTGTIANDKQLNVIPDASFTLSQAHKGDVTATVSQDNTVWLSDSLSTVGNGSVSYDGLSAGTWNGLFNFNINLDNIPLGEDVILTADNLTTYGISTEGDVVIPSIIKDADGVRHRVTGIGMKAFYGCSKLTSINIPNGVTSIGINTFYGCSSLTSINIPNGVTSIDLGAFSSCSSLTSINIPDGVTGIYPGTFYGCSSLTSINIPNGVTSIGGDAFNGCSSLTSINIPESVRNIGDSAFEGCSSLANINIPESVTSINVKAFYNVPHITYHGTATGSPWGAQSIN